MSIYYRPHRASNVYDSKSTKPFRLSRSKIDLFINCPRCFYLDRKLGVSQPPGYPFSLNSAVDKLLKKEFDVHRANGTKHPLCDKYGTNVVITGGVDDVWINPQGGYRVVDTETRTASLPLACLASLRDKPPLRDFAAL